MYPKFEHWIPEGYSLLHNCKLDAPVDIDWTRIRNETNYSYNLLEISAVYEILLICHDRDTKPDLRLLFCLRLSYNDTMEYSDRASYVSTRATLRGGAFKQGSTKRNRSSAPLCIRLCQVICRLVCSEAAYSLYLLKELMDKTNDLVAITIRSVFFTKLCVRMVWSARAFWYLRKWQGWWRT